MRAVSKYYECSVFLLDSNTKEQKDHQPVIRRAGNKLYECPLSLIRKEGPPTFH